MKHFYLLLFSLLLIFMLCGPVAAADVILQSITFETDKASPDREIVHITMKPLRHPLLFGFQGDNPRVVCDFLGAEPADAIEDIIKVDGRLIHRIRVGVHTVPEAKTRIVLDLDPQYDYTIQQIPSELDNRFSIIVSLADKAPAPQEEKKQD